jgi:hypothetical protein
MLPRNMPFQRLKIVILLLGLPCSGIVTRSGEIPPILKSRNKMPDGLFPKDDTEVKEGLRIFLNEIALLLG